MNTNDGGNAFPADPFAAKGPGTEAEATRIARGMTLLDYFATHASDGDVDRVLSDRYRNGSDSLAEAQAEGDPTAVRVAARILWARAMLKERERRAGIVQPDATIWLRNLVAALDSTNWSNWQTTANFQPALDAARAFLMTDGKEGGST